MVLDWLKVPFGKARQKKSSARIQNLPSHNEDTLMRCNLPQLLNNLEMAADSENEGTKKFRTPRNGKRSSAEGWLFKVVTGSDRGRQYIATNTTLKIGRKTDNHIYLKDPKVSRYHAIIRIEGNRLFIRDLRSTNGTKVNNRAVVGEQELFPGEEVKVGDTVIQMEKIASRISGVL
jgi:hypothetical protein